MPSMSAMSTSMLSGMGPPPTPVMQPGMVLPSGMGAMTPALQSGMMSPTGGMVPPNALNEMGPPGNLPPQFNINNLPPEARAMMQQMRAAGMPPPGGMGGMPIPQMNGNANQGGTPQLPSMNQIHQNMGINHVAPRQGSNGMPILPQMS